MLWTLWSIKLFLFVLVFLCFCSRGRAELIDLPVPHFHQVYGVIDWTDGRTFKTPTTGKEKSILYASCWPVSLVELLVYRQAINNNRQAIATAIKQAYNAFADFDDGAHTELIPDYIAHNYSDFYARRVIVDDQKEFPSDRKWQIITSAISQNWPLATSINWVKPRGAIFPHAFVIRGYSDYQTRIVYVNDPAGSFTMTGVWNQAVSGENMQYGYETFFDRYYIIVVPIRQRELLNLFLRYFNL